MQQIEISIETVAGSGSSIWIALHPCLLGSHVYKLWRDVAYALKLIGCALKGISVTSV